MDFGKMDKRIIIQVFEKIKDKNGIVTGEGWKDYKPVWARVNNLWGKEFQEAKKTDTQTEIVFSIRYSKDLAFLEGEGSLKSRIVWKNQAFDITFADNVRYENIEFKIRANRVKK